MVRAIVGTMVYASHGKLEPEEIPALLEKGDRRLTGPTMPPQGLYLNRVWYEGDIGRLMLECGAPPMYAAPRMPERAPRPLPAVSAASGGEIPRTPRPRGTLSPGLRRIAWRYCRRRAFNFQRRFGPCK